MAVNSTDYSDLQDAIRATLVSNIGSTGTGTVQDEAIRIHDGPVDLTPDSMAEWCRTNHGPVVVIKIEGMSDEDDVADGGWRTPRRTWQKLDVSLYLYDETLRGRAPTKAEGTRGLSGITNSPGVFKLINDVRAALSGYVAAVYTTDWEGPHWQDALPVDTQQDKHLWNLSCQYRGAVENSIDTTDLDDFDEIDADYNNVGGTDNPQTEETIQL